MVGEPGASSSGGASGEPGAEAEGWKGAPGGGQAGGLGEPGGPSWREERSGGDGGLRSPQGSPAQLGPAGQELVSTIRHLSPPVPSSPSACWSSWRASPGESPSASPLGRLRKAVKVLEPKREEESGQKGERRARSGLPRPSLLSILARISSTVVPGNRSSLVATGTGVTLKGAGPLREGVDGARGTSSLGVEHESSGVKTGGDGSPFPLGVSGDLMVKEGRLRAAPEPPPLYGWGPARRFIFSAEGSSGRECRGAGGG